MQKKKVVQQVAQQEQYRSAQIDKLEQLGINAADITKLKNSGYHTALSLIMATKKQLAQIKGINQNKIDKLVEAAKKIQKDGFLTGNQLAAKRKMIIKITTGSKSFDQLLGGGIQSMSITQAYGQFRTGKTQLAHTLSVTSQLPKQKGGGNGRVIFIDTQGTFRPQRIYKIAQRYSLDGDQVLQNIRYARAYNWQHLNQLLTISAAMMIQSSHALLIIDSIMACFRVDFCGRGELSERQQMLGRILNKLSKLSDQFNIAIFITNQVMADPSSTMSHMDNKKPIGGHVLAHSSTTRLYFKKGKGDERIVKVTDSPCLGESQTIIQISEGGITDPK